VRVLEIGVQSGGGLSMWSFLFGDALEYTGLDVNPLTRMFDDGDKFRIFVGSQLNTSVLDTISLERGPFDLVIDDGGHHSDMMTLTLNHFYVGPDAPMTGVRLLTLPSPTTFVPLILLKQ
jgi:hypothetical protein